MHPLVHEWARTRLSEVAREDAREQALSILTLSTDDLTLAPELLSHISFCTRSLSEKESQSGISLHVARALYRLLWIVQVANEHEVALAILETLLKSY
jgi:hypothetical protein